MEELFNYCFEQKITPNELYVLYCIKYSKPINKEVNEGLIRIRLISQGLLDDTGIVTVKGYKVLTKTNLKPSKKSNEVQVDYKQMIETYNEIFPKIKLPSGKYARTNEKTLEGSFKWFFQNFNYSWETIIRATTKYVNDFQLQNYKYMRTSQYFIRKQASDKSYDSELADYCNMIESGEEEQENHFKEKVV